MQVGKQIRAKTVELLMNKEAAKVKGPIVDMLGAALTEVWLYLDMHKTGRESMPYDMVDRLFGKLNPLLVKEVLKDAIYNRQEEWIKTLEDHKQGHREVGRELGEQENGRSISEGKDVAS